MTLDMATTAATNISDDLLRQMTRVIVQEVEPERIILFGSRVRGDAQPGSDVDLLVSASPLGKAGAVAAKQPTCGALWQVSPYPRTSWSIARTKPPLCSNPPTTLSPMPYGRDRFFMSEDELPTRLLILARRDLRAAEIPYGQPEVGDGIGVIIPP